MATADTAWRAAKPAAARRAGRAGRAWLWSSLALTAGAIGAAIALAPPAGAAPVRALTWLLFTGSAVHVASTGWLLAVPEVRAYAARHAIRCRWAPLALIAGGAVAAALIAPARFEWLLLPYFCWQFFHYQKQNVGMAALAASALGVRPLRPAERRPLLLAGWAAVAALAAEPWLLGLRLFGPAGPAFAAAGVAFAVIAAAGLVAIARRPRPDRPFGFCATYTASMLFCLPVFVFRSPYAAVGGMTVAHGLQYLLLVGLVARGGREPARLARLAALANVSLIGGAALSWASHLHDAAPATRLLFGAYLGVVMAHFVVDAGLWRMRDPLARQFLTARLPYLAPQAPDGGGTGSRLPIDRRPI